MFRATGYYQTTWTNCAHRNLPRQTPLIAERFTEIARFYQATLNVRFEEKIIIAGYDHRTSPIHWDAKHSDGEVFDLLRVRLTFDGLGGPMEALMYVAHWSVHRRDPHRHEFLVRPKLEGLRNGMTVTLEGDRQAVVLPYTETEYGEHGPRLAKTIVVL